MILIDWLAKWDMGALKIKLPFLETEIKFNDGDKKAAWELYIELLTRSTTQPLDNEIGDEKAALESIFKLFALTRDIIKKYGTGCYEFTKIAIVVLNQIIRPFTSKWHKQSLAGAFNDAKKCKEFRVELENVQDKLKKYTMMLADMADVEDLSDFND